MLQWAFNLRTTGIYKMTFYQNIVSKILQVKYSKCDVTLDKVNNASIVLKDIASCECFNYLCIAFEMKLI